MLKLNMTPGYFIYECMHFISIMSAIGIFVLSIPLRKKTIWDIYVKIICEI